MAGGKPAYSTVTQGHLCKVPVKDVHRACEAIFSGEQCGVQHVRDVSVNCTVCSALSFTEAAVRASRFS